MVDQTKSSPNPSRYQEPGALRVSLLSAPQNPLGTLLYVWLQSRSNNPIPRPVYLQKLVSWDSEKHPLPNNDMIQTAHALGHTGDPPYVYRNDCLAAQKYLRDMVIYLLSEAIPVTEFLTFVVQLDNVSISLREQLVRHRIGVNVDPRIGADIAPPPHLAESAVWALGSRMMDYSTFYDDGNFLLPETLKGVRCVLDSENESPTASMSAEQVYRNVLDTIQEGYQLLQKAGIHIEDCRQLLPMGTTHRLSWSFNYKSISHIVGRRTCWVAQLSLWEPVVVGIATELRKIDPLLGTTLTDPPCFKSGQFLQCPFQQINAERVNGKEGVTAPCPLYLNHHPTEAIKAAESVPEPMWVQVDSVSATDEGDGAMQYLHGDKIGGNGFISHKPFPNGWVSRNSLSAKRMSDGRLSFEKLWARDVDTGVLLDSEN